MSLTSKLSLPYPELADAADVPLWVRDLALLLDVIMGTFGIGLRSARPGPGTEGAFYWSTDLQIMSFDDGTSHRDIGAMAAGSITRAMLHAELKPSGTAAPSDEAIRALGAGANNAAAGTDARFPTADQKAALVGTIGIPSAINPYITLQDTRSVPAVVSVLPSSPPALSQILYTIDAASHRYWQFIWLGGAWVFLGGAAKRHNVDQDEARSSEAYGALTTAGPTLTIPETGRYRVRVGCQVRTTNVNQGGFMSYKIGAAAADDDMAAAGNGTVTTPMNGRELDLIKNTVLLAQYRVNDSGNGSVNFDNRWMELEPVYFA